MRKQNIKLKLGIILLFFFLLIYLMTLIGEETVPSWPQFRGAQRNGISKETGLLQSWPTDGPRLLWKFENCGTGYSGITIADSKILTAGSFPGSTKVIALDTDGKPLWTAKNGSAKWRVPVDKTHWASGYGGTRSTPAISGNKVFHLGISGRLAAFELSSGKEIWSVELKKAFDGICNEWGYSESVLIDGDRLYCLPGGTGGFMVCLDAATGKTIWTCSEILDKKASNASSAMFEINGVKQIVAMTSVLVVGVRAKDGKMLWQFPHTNRFKENCEIPQYVNDILYVTSGYRYGSEGYEVKKTADGKWNVKQVWKMDLADNLHGGPIILDGYVYAAGYDRKGAFCLDLKNGKIKWRQRPFKRSSFAYADNMLYRLGEDGTMALEKPDPERYNLISSFKIPSACKGPALTHPVVCGGKLYIRHQHILYCYDISST